MNKRACSYLVILLILVLVLSVPAFAAEDAKTAEIPVQIKLEGDAPSPAEDYTVQLTADTDGAPMPAGGSGTVYEETITGAGSATLKIDYSKPGVFS